jgi:Cof subfamily protein (haloacid dehalogenase superfamily)
MSMSDSNTIKENAGNVNIKAVFFDIDGTLTSFKTHRVPQSTLEAIRHLKAKGIKVIVATGRSFEAISELLQLEFDGFICFNGSCCLLDNHEVVYRKPISATDIQSLLDYTLTNALSFSLMYEKGVLVSDVTPETVGMYAHLNIPVPPALDRENVDVETVLQANIFLRPEDEKDFMDKVMPDSNSSRWTPLFADVNGRDMSKKHGVESFCNHFGILPEETMAFGDGGNDKTMLLHAGIGVAMGNANPGIKEIANHITDDVDNDGIWNALKYFQVI